ncbi:extensin-2, partial [Schistocerca americana]|uniref:extensin-2 n=1 Tax=Schistocerca americana TaxID=7009 RepID=UPI001F4F7EAA
EAAPPTAAARPPPPTPPPAEDDDDADDEDSKTLSQQIADGKYGLIQKELYGEPPARPGIVSYAANPEVPRDTARTLGGLRPSEVWLAEDHVLVLRGGAFAAPERTEKPPWPPIDDYHAPPRQVRLPARPRVPPPFPVQLADGEPPRLLGNQSRARPRPPFFAPPFPFPGPGAANATRDGAAPPYLYPPPGNFPPGGAVPTPAGNGSLSPPPYPFPPPRNGSLYGPPAGPFPPPPFFFPGPYGPPPTGNATFPPPGNGSFPFPFPFPVNGSLPPGFPVLPPGAALLPPPGLFNDTFDEDDMSIYYPPPYDFYYPTDNTTQVPPGPLVPGIVLPPPPNFFGPLDNETETAGSGGTTVAPPPSETTAGEGYTAKYVPVTTQNRRKKPTPATTAKTVADVLVSTPPPPQPTPATPVPPGRSPSVQVIHDGASPLRPPGYYYYRVPTAVPLTSTVAPPTVILSSTTAAPPPASVSYVVVPVTDIVVRQPSQSQQQQQQQQQRQQHRQRPKAPDPTPPTYFYDPVSDRTPKKSYYFFEEPWRGISFQFPLPSPTLQTLLGQSYRQPTQLYYYSDTTKRQRPSQSVGTSRPPYYSLPQQVSTVPPPSPHYPQSTPGRAPYYGPTTQTPAPYYLQVSTHSYYDIGPSTVRPVYRHNFEQHRVPNTTPGPRTSPPVYRTTTPRTVFEFDYRQQQKFQQPPSYFTPGHTSGDFSRVHVTTPAPSRSQQYGGEQISSSGYSTENPLSALFTRQDESLIDENTKRYFTIFGQKLPQQESEIPSTTPMPITKEQQNLKEALPLSLEGDTLVNYRPPLPAANPESEFIAYPLPGDGAHAYFLPPGGGYSYPAPVPNQRLRYRRKDTGSEVT